MKPYPKVRKSLSRRKPAEAFATSAAAVAKSLIDRITFWNIIKGLALILVVIPLLVYVRRELNRDVVVIEPIAVPKSFSDAGLSSDVMANRVGQRIREIEDSAKTRLNKDMLGLESEQLPVSDIEIPGTKLGLKTIVDISRTLFKRYPRHIAGDIVLPITDTQISVQTADPEQRGATVTIYLRQGDAKSGGGWPS
jgi:hypothetical protein